MSELFGKGFCVAGLVRLGQELTDSCLGLWNMPGGGERRGKGEEESSPEACPNRAVPRELLPVMMLLCSFTHSFIHSSHSANVC